MVGMLIALVKLQHIATVVPGVGAWAFGAVMVLLAAATVAFNPRDMWARIDTLQSRRRHVTRAKRQYHGSNCRARWSVRLSRLRPAL